MRAGEPVPGCSFPSSALPMGPPVCLPSACGYLDSLGPCTDFWFPGSGVAPPAHACLPPFCRKRCLPHPTVLHSARNCIYSTPSRCFLPGDGCNICGVERFLGRSLSFDGPIILKGSKPTPVAVLVFLFSFLSSNPPKLVFSPAPFKPPEWPLPARRLAGADLHRNPWEGRQGLKAQCSCPESETFRFLSCAH